MASRASSLLSAALACLLAFGILTLWIPAQWPVSIVQTGIYALTGLWLLGAAAAGFPLRLHVLLIPVAGAAVWGCVQLAAGTTIYRWATEVAVLDWFTRLAVLFLAYQLFSEERLRERFLGWALWFGFAISVLAVLQRFTAPDRVFWLFDVPPGGVTMGPFVYHNQYAAFIELLLPLALAGALHERDWRRAVAAGVMIASVVAAVSRAGTALVLLETIVVFALVSRRRRLDRRSVALAAATTVLIAVVFAASVGWGPLREKFDREDQLSERRNLYASTIEMAGDRPLMGFGLGTWATAYPPYATFDDGLRDNQAHNDWLQWASEGGLPMLALMLAMAGLLVRPALRSVWGVGLLAVLVHCLVDYHFQQRPVFGYWWFAMAGLVGSLTAQHHGYRAGQDMQFEPE